MSLSLPRKKKKNLLVSFIYRIFRIPILSDRYKLKLFLNLEWIFGRLSHEYSYKLYPSLEHPVRKTTEDFLLKYVSAGDHVLDLGCNLGENSYLLSKKAAYVVGVDYNRSAVNKAEADYGSPKLKFVCDDAIHYLSSSGEKFDVLILAHILEHIDNPAGFLQKFSVHFSRIYIEVPDWEATFLNQYRADLQLDLKYTDADHIIEFTRNDLLKLFDEAGIRVIESQYKFGVQKYWCKTKNG